jgi:hypothetical protein
MRALGGSVPRVYVGSLLATLLLAGCGGPPTAREILAKPANSNLKDAHVTVTGHVASGAFSMDITGDGVFLLKPKTASDLRVQGNVGAIPIAVEFLSIDGKDYQRTGSAKWTVTNSTSGSSWADAKDASLVGEENLPGGKAWHVKASGSDGKPFELWVRESDSYPLRLSGAFGDSGTINLVFDKFNTGASVSAPASSDVKPPAKNVTAKVGEAVALNGATVTVVSADLNFNNTNEFLQPKAGNRLVAVEILYENTGTETVSYNPLDWKLTDSSGFNYDHSYSGKGPELSSGDLGPSEKARGFITYEVPKTSTGLSLKLTLGDDTMMVSLD